MCLWSVAQRDTNVAVCGMAWRRMPKFILILILSACAPAAHMLPLRASYGPDREHSMTTWRLSLQSKIRAATLNHGLGGSLLQLEPTFPCSMLGYRYIDDVSTLPDLLASCGDTRSGSAI